MIRKEKLLRELTALQSSLPELERWTEILRCIERPIWMDSCTLLIKFLREVQADIQPLNGALESFSLEKEPEFEPLKINGGYLWQLADDIILRLVVYRPHSRLVTKVYLKQRRSIATDMQHLIEAMKLMVLPNSLSAQEWRASSLLSLVEVHQEEDQAGAKTQEDEIAAYAIGQGVHVTCGDLQAIGIVYEVLPQQSAPYHVLYQPGEDEEPTGRVGSDGACLIAVGAQELALLREPLPASLVTVYQRRRAEEAQV